MKKLLSIFLCIMGLVVANAQIPTNGLVAWYPFDGNANDGSGNGFNVTMHGSTLTTDRFGNPSSAYFLDGNDWGVYSNVSSGFYSGSWSKSFWISPSNYSSAPLFIGSNYGYVDIFMNQLFTVIGTSTGIQSCNGVLPQLLTWSHVVAVFDSYNNQLRLFLNGNQIGASSTTGTINIAFGQVWIGKRPNNTGFYTGKIDDIRIYNQALTQSEVTALFEEGSCSAQLPIVQNISICGPGVVTLTASGGAFYNWYNTPTGGSVIGTGSNFSTPILTQTTTYWVSNTDTCESSRVPVTANVMNAHISQNDTTICSGSTLTLNIGGASGIIPTDGLVAWYPFNGNANDNSGNNNNGTVNGATLTSDRFSNPDKAYSFNGTSMITVPYNSSFDFNTTVSFTTSAWIKINPFSDYFRSYLAYACPDGQGGGGFQLMVDENSSHPLYYEGPTFLQTGGVLSDLGWHNAVTIWDQNKDSMFVYLDNILIGKLFLPVTQFYTPECYPNIRIGGERNGQLIHYFKGSIDDVRFYNRVLTLSEIDALYNENATSSGYTYIWSTGDTTDSITVSPNQTTTYTVTITNGTNSCIDSTTITITGSSISGKLTYDGISNTPVSCANIYLKTTNNITVDSTLTDLNGDYRLCNIPDGSYKISVKTTKVPGGFNSIDALDVLRHYTGYDTLVGLKYLAGDVNATGYINSSDALIIAKRYVEIINTFPIGDWVFEEPQVNITGSSALVINFMGICVGDVNGSYIPLSCDGFQSCGDTLTDIRDGQKYPTVLIGTQCWMKKNLNIGTMVTSTIQGQIHSDCSNNGIIEKYCYGNNLSNCNEFGGLYDWNEMMQYTAVSGAQGICPTGWHIPTHGEFDILIFVYGGGMTPSGGKMKEAGFVHWAAPNTGATNDLGFTAYGGGYRDAWGWFNQLLQGAAFWESSDSGSSYNWRALDCNSANISWSVTSDPAGYSVRCLKDM